MSGNESPIENLGNARIGSDGALSLPSEVVEWDVLSPGSDAYWAYDQSNDRLVVTMARRSLDDHADYTRIGSTPVSEDGELTLPDEVTAEGDERPWTGRLANGDSCYFDSTVDLLGDNLSYALTEQQHEAFWND